MSPARDDSDVRALLDGLAMQSREREALEQQLAAAGASAFRSIERISGSGRVSRVRVLTRYGVAALLSAAEESPVAPGSISRWIRQSQPGERLAEHPFPAPKHDDSGRPYWEEEQARNILDWYYTRPGRREQYRPPDRAMLSATVAVANADGSPGGEIHEEMTSEGLAALLGVSPVMLSRYRTDSRPGQKYADDPFPAGRKGPDNRLRWTSREVQDAVEWKKRNQVGRGRGGGTGAHKSALPRWDPQRRLHAWHPSMRKAKPGQERFCRFCGEGVLGKQSIGECPGLAPDRAARLSQVQLRKVHGPDAKAINAEVQAGLVQLAPAKDKVTIFELTPAGAEWLNHYVEAAS